MLHSRRTKLARNNAPASGSKSSPVRCKGFDCSVEITLLHPFAESRLQAQRMRRVFLRQNDSIELLKIKRLCSNNS